MSSYKGVFEASVITVDTNGEPIYPYYSQKLIKKYVASFIAPNIKKYTSNYKFTIKFYDKDGITECTSTDLSRNVKIKLDAKINYLFRYTKTQSFTIKERNEI